MLLIIASVSDTPNIQAKNCRNFYGEKWTAIYREKNCVDKDGNIRPIPVTSQN